MFTFSYTYVNKQWKDKQETGYLWREGYEQHGWKQDFSSVIFNFWTMEMITIQN